MGGIGACSHDASDKRSETVMISGMTGNPPTHPVRDPSISTDGLTDEQAKTVDEPAPLNNHLASCMSAKCFELVRSNEHNSSAS